MVRALCNILWEGHYPILPVCVLNNVTDVKYYRSIVLTLQNRSL